MVVDGKTGRGLRLESLGSATQEIRAPAPGTTLTVAMIRETADARPVADPPGFFSGNSS